MRLLSVLALAAFTTANADAPQPAKFTESEITLVKLHAVTSDDGDELIHNGKMTEQDAQSIVDAVDGIEAALSDLFERQRNVMCARRDELATDRSALADLFEKNKAVDAAVRDKLVSDLLASLSASQLKKLNEAFSYVGEPGGVGFDLPGDIRSGKMDPVWLMKRACDLTATPPPPLMPGSVQAGTPST